jgi:hypothetical protein
LVSADRACLRACVCVCVCVNWDLFIVDSAIQHAFAIKLRATRQQSAIQRVPLIFITALLLFRAHKCAYFDALLHAHSTNATPPTSTASKYSSILPLIQF